MATKGQIAFALAFAILLPVGMSTGPVERQTGIEGPVGEADAIACGGVCIAGIAAGAMMIGGAAGAIIASGNEVNESADSEQTEVDLYSAGAATHQNGETIRASISNRIADARTIARLEGKNAYIRSLQNDSSQVQAESAAASAIEDYYSSIQLNLRTAWDTQNAHLEHLESVSENASGVGNNYIAGREEESGGSIVTDGDPTFGEGEVSLVNGTTVNVTELDGMQISQEDSCDCWVEIEGGLDGVSDDDPIEFRQEPYVSRWTEISDESSTVTSEVQTFISNTYSSWESEEWNETDLIDPYLGAREYGPEEGFQSWSLMSQQALGMSGPENLSTIGSFTVDNGTQTFEGILLSDGLPEGDEFETGVVYDASMIPGIQAVQTTDGTEELKGEFSITEITTSDGETVENVTYRNVTYETTSAEEYKNVTSELTSLRNELEEIRIEDTGGGPLLPGLGAVGIPGILLLAAGAYLVINGGLGSNDRPRRRRRN